MRVILAIAAMFRTWMVLALIVPVLGLAVLSGRHVVPTFSGQAATVGLICCWAVVVIAAQFLVEPRLGLPAHRRRALSQRCAALVMFCLALGTTWVLLRQTQYLYPLSGWLGGLAVVALLGCVIAGSFSWVGLTLIMSAVFWLRGPEAGYLHFVFGHFTGVQYGVAVLVCGLVYLMLGSQRGLERPRL